MPPLRQEHGYPTTQPKLRPYHAPRPLLGIADSRSGCHRRHIHRMAVAPEKALLTCHDEYLLPSMVQGIDGALVGFASLIPGLIWDLLEAVRAGDLTEAMRLQGLIDPLKTAVYGSGEPTGEAHACMKAAMVAAGIFRSARMRPPTVEPSAEELARIDAAVRNAGIAAELVS